MLFTIICFLIGIYSIIQRKSALKGIDVGELERELEMAEIEKYHLEKVFLTEHYLISTAAGMHITEIKDVAWIYLSYDTEGYRDLCHLTIHLRNGKTILTQKIKRVMENELKGIIVELMQKNPNLLAGYSYENLEQYNKIKMTYQ